MSKTASTEVVARIREFVAEHQAGRLTWEACADALLEAPGTKYREDLTEPAVEALPPDIFARIEAVVVAHQHWFRGIGDGDAACELFEAADGPLE